MTASTGRTSTTLCSTQRLRLGIPTELDTAYVYLANAQAQQGFAQAVQATAGLKSQLEGQTEKLVARTTLSGAVVFTNRESDQTPAFYDAPFVGGGDKEATTATETEGEPPTAENESVVKVKPVTLGQAELPGFGEEIEPLDVVSTEPAPGTVGAKPNEGRPASKAELMSFLNDEGIRVYSRTERGAKAPASLKRESKPELDDMSAISKAVAGKLHLDKELENNAVRAALDRFREKEVHTELTTNERSEQEVAVVTDRLALSREALALLRALPQVEDEDVRIVIDVLTGHAVRLHWLQQHPDHAGHYEAFRADAWSALYASPPAEVESALIAAFAHLLGEARPAAA